MSVYISQLPEYSGSAADLRWFIMNNSGQTTTFKYSGYTSQVIPGNGIESYVTINVPRTHAPDDYMLVFGNHSGATASSGANSAVLGGKNNRTENQYGGVVGGQSNIVGYNCFVGGGQSNYANGNSAAIVGGYNNVCSNVSIGGIFGGSQNQMYAGNDEANNMIGGISNKFSFNGVKSSTMVGGSVNRWHHFDGRAVDTRYSYGTMIGGFQNRIEGNTTDSAGAHAYPLLMGGTLNKIFGEESDDTGTTGATIINSFTSTIKKSLYSSIFGSYTSTIISATTSSIIGGLDNALNLATGSSIIAGNSCSIIGASTYSGILGGTDNDITATNKSAIIGGSQNYMSGASESGIFAGFQNTNNGSMSAVIGSRSCSISSPSAERSAIIASYNSSITGNTDQSFVVGGNNNSIGAGESFILGGNYSQVTGGGNNEIIGSRESTITGGNDVSLINTIKSNSGSYDRVVMLGTSGRTSTTSSATFVENLVVFNYAGLNFLNDTAAAAGGVVLGQVYHNAGALRIRIV